MKQLTRNSKYTTGYIANVVATLVEQLNAEVEGAAFALTAVKFDTFGYINISEDVGVQVFTAGDDFFAVPSFAIESDGWMGTSLRGQTFEIQSELPVVVEI